MNRNGNTVLVNPKSTDADEIGQKCFPPFGLLYLGASLRQEGLGIQVIDANALRLSDDTIAVRIARVSPSVIGLPVYAETLFAAGRLLPQLRRAAPTAFLVAGGPQATAAPRLLLEELPDLDGVLAGEAEATLPQLVRSVQEGRTTRGIPGLFCRGLPDPDTAALRTDLSSLPRAARDLVAEALDQNRYFTVLRGHSHLDCIVTSRGCPHRCRFCYNSAQATRFRAIDDCLEELHELRARGVRTVEVLDDSFAASRSRALELLDRIRQERLGLELRIKVRADAVDERVVRAARDAGVYQVSIGAESGSQRMLDAMGKGIKLQQIVSAIQTVKRFGMNCHTGWLVGYPGETRETLAQTADLVTRLRPTTANFSVLLPYPGTAVYEEARAAGTLVGEWRSSDPEVPWVRLPWTRTRADLVRARNRVMRRVYLRPYYVGSFGWQILAGMNPLLARYAVQEFLKVSGLRRRGRAL